MNKTYKSKHGEKCHAVKNADVGFDSKGIYFILGKSGSGKSTLLNLIFPSYNTELVGIEIRYFYLKPMTLALMGLVTFGIMPLFTLLPLIAITKLNPVDAIKK